MTDSQARPSGTYQFARFLLRRNRLDRPLVQMEQRISLWLSGMHGASARQYPMRKHNGEPDRAGLVWQLFKGGYVGNLRAIT